MALFAFAMATIGIGDRGIWESDEGRYTAVAVEMLESGDWLTPRLDLDAPHLTKPPLTYWSVAASLAVFGKSEWAARVPNLIAFVLTVLIVLRLGRRFVPERPWLPALIYATLPATVLGANVVTTDTLLTLFEALAVMFWLEGRLTWMWVAFGLGFLTKGPPVLLPLFAIFAVMSESGPERGLRFPWDLPGFVAFLLIGLSWFVWLVAGDPALAGYFIGDELIGRVASDEFKRNSEWYAPVTVYLPVLLGGTLPWLLATGGALPAWFRGMGRTSLRAQIAKDPDAAFLWSWFALPFLVFCVSQSRQPSYMLPLFVPLALALGRALAQRFEPRAPAWRALIALAIGLPLALKLWLGGWDYYKDTRGLASQVTAEFAPQRDDRIVFFGRWPQWGLRVYQPARVGWREADAGQSLCDALAATPRRTLVIVSNKRPADLAGALTACGRAPARRLAPYRDMGLFEVR